MSKKLGKDFLDWAAKAGADATTEDMGARKLIGKMKAERDEARRLLKVAEHELELAEIREAVLGDIRESRLVLPPISGVGRKKKSRDRGMPFLVCSDWHVEEVVNPQTVNNRNEYGPEIAKKRARYLTTGAVWLAQQWAQSWQVDEMVIFFGGDLISGYIHEELEESNALSPTEATLLAMALMRQLIEQVLTDCPFIKRLHVMCSYGNHGRTTKKRRHSTGAKNSFEWLAYKTLEQEYAKHDRVEVTVANGAHMYRQLYGVRTRFTHGDDVNYWGGIGGLSIPLQKACDAWDEFEPAHVTVIGHYHQLRDFGYALVNGSMIGYNAYALAAKCRWEPARQAMFLIDEEWGAWGKRCVTPIFCDPDRKAS